MITLYNWAFDYPGPNSLPAILENDKEKLTTMIDLVEWCNGKQFTKDIDEFKKEHGREPTDLERPAIHIPFMNYDTTRKQEYLTCVLESMREHIQIEGNYILNVSLRLWAGCLDTAKTIALKTQTGRNTGQLRRAIFNEKKCGIDVVASRDPIYRSGVEISSLWQPDADNVCFDGVPDNSSARKYEKEWSDREGIRVVKQCKK